MIKEKTDLKEIEEIVEIYGSSGAKLDAAVMDVLIEKLNAQAIKPQSITVGTETFYLTNSGYVAAETNAEREVDNPS